MGFLTAMAVLLQILSALGVIVLVLLQQGKGADMGAAFGSGSAGSFFGASGSANFLSRSTAVLATVFFVCTLVLAFFAHTRGATAQEPASVMEGVTAPAKPANASSAPGTPKPEKSGMQKNDSSVDIPK
jgi:preprotein translocase subunit SecG